LQKNSLFDTIVVQVQKFVIIFQKPYQVDYPLSNEDNEVGETSSNEST